ncbi:hypothetical protein ACFSUK_31800 [Sphingobium scionense]
MRIERWAVGELDRNPSIGSAVVREMWEGALDAGVTNATAIWVVGQGHSSVAIGLAIEEILSLRPGMAVDPLRMIISEAMLRIPRPSLEHLTDAALRRNDLLHACGRCGASFTSVSKAKRHDRHLKVIVRPI